MRTHTWKLQPERAQFGSGLATRCCEAKHPSKSTGTVRPRPLLGCRLKILEQDILCGQTEMGKRWKHENQRVVYGGKLPVQASGMSRRRKQPPVSSVTDVKQDEQRKPCESFEEKKPKTSCDICSNFLFTEDFNSRAEPPVSKDRMVKLEVVQKFSRGFSELKVN